MGTHIHLDDQMEIEMKKRTRLNIAFGYRGIKSKNLIAIAKLAAHQEIPSRLPPGLAWPMLMLEITTEDCQVTLIQKNNQKEFMALTQNKDQKSRPDKKKMVNPMALPTRSTRIVMTRIRT